MTRSEMTQAVVDAGPGALETLIALTADGNPGNVRVAAARHLLDLALTHVDGAAELARLDQALQEFKADCMAAQRP